MCTHPITVKVKVGESCFLLYECLGEIWIFLHNKYFVFFAHIQVSVSDTSLIVFCNKCVFAVVFHICFVNHVPHGTIVTQWTI